MKLRNKKTGEIVEPYGISCKNMQLSVQFCDEKGNFKFECYSLAELNEEWEDYKEPKQWYGLNAIRDVGFEPLEYKGFEDLYKHAKELGIAFETKEEAKQAVKKLKAWKRLKDKGFRFDGKTLDTSKRYGSIFYWLDKNAYSEDYIDDLDLLFGGD